MLPLYPNLAMWMPGGPELIIIGVVALLIFGKRLPEVARSMGKSIVEFKKGIRDVKDDLDHADDKKPREQLPPADESAREESSKQDE